jgi:tRNA/tmRNA/rRNA uracil-C5-methylase (TrmA/RlmC/RlmD family)
VGDILKVVSEHDFDKPDVMILDPPRDGIHPKALPKLIALNASKIVYVSCKPASLARDLVILRESGYQATALRLHDMFPRTPHIETVCLLEKTL